MGLLYSQTEDQNPGGGGGNDQQGVGPVPPVPATVGGIGEFQTATTAPQKGGGGPAGLNLGPAFPAFGFSPVPKFTAPQYVPLDAKSVLNDPGYQFRIQQGEEGLQRSAAAKGLLRTGGTLKDLIQYDQNFASNEYNQAEERNRATYGLNYQRSKDEYAPLLDQWNTLSGAQLQKALATYNRGTIWGAPRTPVPGYPEQLLGPGQFGL